MRQHRPLGQGKTCPRWYFLRAESDKRDTWDRPSDDSDDTCATMLTTLCVSTTDVHIAKRTQTHKERPSKSPKQDCKHDKETNMPKDDHWSNKKKGWKDSIRVHGMSSSVWNHQQKNQGRLSNLNASQNFGGCCSSYNTSWHIGWIPASLFWFIF